MVGTRIKEYVKEKGIKQTFIAQAAGVSDGVLSDMFNKGRKIEVTEYVKICKALGVPLDHFVKDILEGKEVK